MKYIYVAGPITKGDQHLNVRNAILAAEQLRAAGFVPFLPHLCFAWHMIAPVDYEEWMAYDFAWIARCDALVRLPGESNGADREVLEAERLGLPVFTLDVFITAQAVAKSSLGEMATDNDEALGIAMLLDPQNALNRFAHSLGVKYGRKAAAARDARPCPSCNAPVGEYCKSDDGKSMIHKERLQ
jgi:hypothetical protein